MLVFLFVMLCLIGLLLLVAGATEDERAQAAVIGLNIILVVVSLAVIISYWIFHTAT